MKRIGEAKRVAQGLVVVRSPDDTFPDVGSEVLTEDLSAVGEVVEVFGPVDRPYCSVTTPDDVHPASVVGSVLYAR